MKFEIKQAIVEFRSNDEFYELEESGKKPNTVRELTFDEVESLNIELERERNAFKVWYVEQLKMIGDKI